MGVHLYTILALTTLYVLFIVLVFKGLKIQSRRRIPPDGVFGKATVLIPYRNEKENLPLLIMDLAEQSYPKELLQVVLVNDHSSDGSERLVRDLLRDHPGFTCLDLPKGREGKKEAVAMGIDASLNPWIIQTDADCRVGPDFIRSHMAFRTVVPSDLVAGIVTTGEGGGGLIERFERLELLSMAGAGGGSFHYRRALMCSGANLAYSRELYRETREYDPADKVVSGDDMFLLVGARKKGRVLSFILSEDSVVSTRPVPGMRSLIRQRIRWGSKAPYYKMIDIQAVAVLVAATNLMLLLLPLWIALTPDFWPWLTVSLGLKTAADLLLLLKMTSFTGQRKTLRSFLPASLLYYPLQAVVLIASLWKRQSKW